MHFLTAKQVCYLTRIPYQTLNYWVKIGAITPMHDPGGKGNHRLFGLTSVVALTVGRGLRGKGFSLQTAMEAMTFLEGVTEERLEACFADGRRWLLIQAGEQVVERLMTEQEMSTSKVMARIAALSGIPPVALDVEKVYRFTIEAADNPEAATEPVEVMA